MVTFARNVFSQLIDGCFSGINFMSSMLLVYPFRTDAPHFVNSFPVLCKDYFTILREKCPNTEFFQVRIFPISRFWTEYGDLMETIDPKAMVYHKKQKKNKKEIKTKRYNLPYKVCIPKISSYLSLKPGWYFVYQGYIMASLTSECSKPNE